MSATASIVTGTRESTLTVPRQALKTSGKDSAVLVVDDADRVRLQSGPAGLQSDDRVEVTQGLAEGQRIATSQLSDLRDGDLVAARGDGLVASTAGAQ